MSSKLSLGTQATLVAACALLFFGMFVSAPSDSNYSAWTTGAQACVVVVAALSIFLWRRDRRIYDEALRREELERTLAEERIAIARDLHDIVSHGLGLMTMRAAVANAVDEDPARLRAALKDVEAISRSTTMEMRRMVRVLRGDGTPLDPLPGVEGIDGLVAQARRSGLRIDFDGSGTTANSAGVSVTVYRIVQEALANVARHVGPTRVRLGISRDGPDLVVEIVDEGSTDRSNRGSREGHGLRGLRERVEALGGHFACGSRGRGFAVAASIPDPAESWARAARGSLPARASGEETKR